MKKLAPLFLAISVTFTSYLAFALPNQSTLAKTCSKIGSLAPYMTEGCLAAAQGNSTFDQHALGACGRLQDNVSNQVIYPCVMAIRDKVYTDDEVNNCDSMRDGATTIRCFRDSGSIKPGSPESGGTPAPVQGPTVEELNTMIDYVVTSVTDFKTEMALNGLNTLRAKINGTKTAPQNK
jgi:hypothetical protein